eukprot:RCo033744
MRTPRLATISAAKTLCTFGRRTSSSVDTPQHLSSSMKVERGKGCVAFLRRASVSLRLSLSLGLLSHFQGLREIWYEEMYATHLHFKLYLIANLSHTRPIGCRLTFDLGFFVLFFSASYHPFPFLLL